MLELMQPLADALDVSLETILVIVGLFGFVVSLFVINTIVAILSDKKRVPSHTALNGGDKKRKKVRDHFLLAGPAFSGKTQLYYKLIGGSISDTVSSSAINETSEEVQVRVPTRLIGGRQQTNEREDETNESQQYTKIGVKLVDVPGHFNFRRSV